MLQRPSCAICGKVATLRFSDGDTLCVACQKRPNCFACSRATGGRGDRAASQLPDGRTRCARCTARAVDSQGQVARELPPIRADLSRLGIRLQDRVHVKLISRSELLDAIPDAGYRTWGFTMSRIDAVGPAIETNIGVLAGLPYELFGMTVSHEAGHAWLHQNGGPLQDRSTEEGFCNLVAAAWLKGRGTPMAERLLASLLADPDPVYGDGYRSVRTAAKQHGVASVIETLTREGRLP